VKAKSGFSTHDVEEGSARTVLAKPDLLNALAFRRKGKSLRSARDLQQIARDVAISLFDVVSKLPGEIDRWRRLSYVNRMGSNATRLVVGRDVVSGHL
jgi:hypothetical protein